MEAYPMSLNELKRTFLFSDIEAKKIVENALQDQADVYRMSISGVLEQSILNGSIFPDYPTFSAYLRIMYSPSSPYGYQWVMQNVFSFLAAGDQGYNARYTNGLTDLCNLGRAYAYRTATFKDEDEYKYFRFQSESVVAVMRQAAERSSPLAINNVAGFLSMEANHLEKIISLAAESLSVETEYLFGLCAACSEQLCDFSHTYRMLSWVSAHCEWEETPRSRVDLIKTLKKISRNWD